jgi:hypothetical protein
MTACSDSPSGLDRERTAHVRRFSVTKIEQKWNIKFDFTMAAPSFVIPAGAAENSRFLADYFSEISLLFFETEACLKYTDLDLPPDLANLPVKWHVHLPLDLPWYRGLDTAFEKIAGLIKKAAYLSPHVYVLHPPTVPNMLVPLAHKFHEVEIDPANILLENVDETDLVSLWDEALEGGYSTCLDLGHIITYSQHSILDLPGLWETVRMLHLYAPGEKGRHTSLVNLDKNGQELLRTMIEHFQGNTLTMEVFDEKGIFESADLLARLLSGWRNEK